jgi:EAL domain-containing protein (putative c-di-GMP-specific phosphodiesterase class I)
LSPSTAALSVVGLDEERRNVPEDGQTNRLDTETLVLNGEPELEYQPLVDLGSGRLLGFEALLRWRHPGEGMIMPRLLIPWLEANGDIVQVGEWVMAEGCRQAATWPENIQLAINCSLVQLRRGQAATSVVRALEQSGLAPGRLTVEVTEHAMSEEVAMKDLRAINELGVELAVDDVGTSWTSFDVLRRMAINTVKIDRSFVGALEAHQGINRMVVETVVSLSHSSGMSTVAEGVETSLQSEIVREFESDAAQGYFFAPPLSLERASELAHTPGYCFALDGEGWMRTAHPADQPNEAAVEHEPFSLRHGAEAAS